MERLALAICLADISAVLIRHSYPHVLNRNLKFVALPVPEIIGRTQKIGRSLDTPTLPFYRTF